MLIIQRPEIEAGEAEGNTQSFIISPLEPGFGHTLGNSLRRTLLSSIPGAAVTQIRFDDALHEFDTIKGVKEDVTDLILNLKDLVLRCASEEAVTLRLDARGPGEVTAGDIQVTSDVEILNPELVDRDGERRAAASRSTSPSSRAAATCRPSGPRRPATRSASSRSTRSSRRCGGSRSVVDADPRRAGHQLRPAHARDRDRRLDHPARRARVGGRHAAQSRRSHRRPLRRARAGSSSARPRRDGDVARPRPADRGARPVGTAAELPEAGPGRHDRPARAEDRGRPARDHELRFEVARGGHPEARRAGPLAARQGVGRCRGRRRVPASAGPPDTTV